MKKPLLLLLLAAIILPLTATAKPLTVKWNLPGAVQLRVGSIVGDFVDIDPDATEYKFAEAPTYVYVLPDLGFAIEAAKISTGDPNTENLKVSSNSTSGQFVSASFYSATLNKMGDDPTLTIEAVAVDRDKTFTLTVENGSSCINGVFTSILNYKFDIQNGTNTVHFSEKWDTSLTFSLIAGLGADTFNKIELNGTPVEKNKFRAEWPVGQIKPGDEIVIRVFEGEEVTPDQVELTLDIPTGCVRTIRDWTRNLFIELPADGKISLSEGTDIAFNLDTDDFTYTSFTLGGKDIASAFNEDSGVLRFKVEQSAELVIKATERVYEEVTMTAYIMNPEGVELLPGYFNTTDRADLSAGADVASDITAGDFTLEASKTLSYELTMSMRAPYFYVRPAAGWYIKAVLGDNEGSINYLNRVEYSAKMPYFYIIAEPLVNDAKIDVDLLGDIATAFNPNASIQGMWSNPQTRFDIKTGSQTIDFVAGYDDPFTVRSIMADIPGFGVWLDGLAIKPDDDGNYLVAYTAPDTATDALPCITINNTGAAKNSGTIALSGDDDAKVFYSALRHPALTPMTYLEGTLITIAPSFEGAEATLNGEKLTPDAGSNTFTFALPAGKALVELAKEGAGISGISTDAQAPVEYFNLQGIRVDNPRNGIFIRRQGSASQKVVL